MKILITAKYVSGEAKYGGSSRFFDCLAKALTRNGHIVTRVPAGSSTGGDFDLAICSHYIPDCSGVKVFVSHGIIKDEEMRHGADTYVAVSEEVRKKNAGYKSIVIPQPINGVHIAPPNVELRNILIIQRDSKPHKAFDALNSKYNVMGSDITKPIEEQIAWADLVVSLGRGALEAMSLGRPVIIADNRGYIGPLGDGYVTEKNVMEIARCNFSGRCYRHSVTPEWLLSEAEKYDWADGAWLRVYVGAYHEARRIAEKYAGLCS